MKLLKQKQETERKQLEQHQEIIKNKRQIQILRNKYHRLTDLKSIWYIVKLNKNIDISEERLTKIIK